MLPVHSLPIWSEEVVMGCLMVFVHSAVNQLLDCIRALLHLSGQGPIMGMCLSAL